MWLWWKQQQQQQKNNERKQNGKFTVKGLRRKLVQSVTAGAFCCDLWISSFFVDTEYIQEEFLFI